MLSMQRHSSHRIASIDIHLPSPESEHKGDQTAMVDDDFGPDNEEKDSPEILLSIAQSIQLQTKVAEGKFSSMDEAIAKSSEELQLTKVGEDWYSAEALERLNEGIRQAESGELIPGEEVMAELDEWIKKAEAQERT